MKNELVNIIIENLKHVYEMGQTFPYFKKTLNPLLVQMNLELDNYPEEDEEDLWDPKIKYNRCLSTENLELIYHTYGSFYYLTKRYVSMMENRNNRPFWQYMITPNTNTPEFILSLSGKIFKYDDPFWDKFYPPNYPGCNAIVGALTIEEVENRNLQISSGEKIIHPFPEWAFNPAKFNWIKFFGDFIVETFKIN